MLRLVSLPTIGTGEHRSGWPYTMRYVREICSASSTVLLDDYVEHTFLSSQRTSRRIQHRVPWVGIFHHPPDMPDWYDKLGLNHLDGSPDWRASFPFLRLAVTLSDISTDWISTHWKTPCVTIKHPTAGPKVKWSATKYLSCDVKNVVQVGSFLRNTHAIYQVRVPDEFSKIRLLQSADWIEKAHERCREVFSERPYVGSVTDVRKIDDRVYDSLLSRSVVFIELIAAAANNVVVECIARDAPILVNRMKSVEFYLGREYPFFYEHLEDVYDLLSEERVISAHLYLRGLNKSWISPRSFVKSLARACKLHVPELRK
jgi:hypothetical protein